MMAVGVYDALRSAACASPEDVSVVGYDDREIAQFMRPPLTTVVLPHTEMGLQAVEALIDGQTLPGRRQPQIKVECPLVDRESRRPAEPLTPGLSNRGHASVIPRRPASRRSRP